MRLFTCVFSLLIMAKASYIDDGHDELSSVSLGHGPDFNYTCLGGPLNWFDLDMKHNALCASGRYQSPINIDSNIHSVAGGIGIQIPLIDIAHFKNLGSTVEITLSEGRLFTPTGRYALNKFHFYTPSEHRIDEESYPLEVHFVFKDPGKHPIAVFLFPLTFVNTLSW